MVLLPFLLIACNKQNGIQNPPSFEINSQESITLPCEGGNFTITYTLQNPIEGVSVEAITDADWITLTENNMAESKLEFNALENNDKQPRETSIVVTYDEISYTINVMQSEFCVNIVAEGLSGYYYGDEYTSGIGNYWIILSEKPADQYDNKFYRVDLYGAVTQIEIGEADMIPVPYGTYAYDALSSYSKGTFSGQFSGYWEVDAEGNNITNNGAPFSYQTGTYTVDENGCTLEVTINNIKHIITYNGTVELQDKRTSDCLSTLTDDLVVNLENCTAKAVPYGDYYECDAFNWSISLMPDNGIGEYLMLDINTTYTTEEEGLGGTYTIATSGSDVAPGTYIYGFIYGNMSLQGSWWYNSIDGVAIEELAPFNGGTITITDHEDGTITIDLNVIDDNNNSITGSWTGKYEVMHLNSAACAKRDLVSLPYIK